MPLKEKNPENRGKWIWGLEEKKKKGVEKIEKNMKKNGNCERKKKGVVHRWGKLRP